MHYLEYIQASYCAWDLEIMLRYMQLFTTFMLCELNHFSHYSASEEPLKKVYCVLNHGSFIIFFFDTLQTIFMVCEYACDLNICV